MTAQHLSFYLTLPLFQALTTGTIPGFVDVVLNFDSSSLEEDNLLYQMKRAGKQLVFYGDDTWLKLFPDHFVRSDGTTSFFVSDYTEVCLLIGKDTLLFFCCFVFLFFDFNDGLGTNCILTKNWSVIPEIGTCTCKRILRPTL